MILDSLRTSSCKNKSSELIFRIFQFSSLLSFYLSLYTKAGRKIGAFLSILSSSCSDQGAQACALFSGGDPKCLIEQLKL